VSDVRDDALTRSNAIKYRDAIVAATAIEPNQTTRNQTAINDVDFLAARPRRILVAEKRSAMAG